MKPQRCIIAGTGTDVGKTTLAARCARALVADRRVLAVKPIETGFSGLDGSDAARLAEAAGHPSVPPAFQAREPLAPMRAANHAGLALELGAFAPWLARLEEEHRPDVTLVETAGGLFTPLTRTETNVELGLSLAPDTWILVARNRLGTLHDVIAAVSAARPRGCLPMTVILGPRDRGGPSSNALDLESILELPVLEDPDDDALLASFLTR